MRRSVLLPLVALAACRPASQTVMQDVPARSWQAPVTVVFDPADTVTLNDLCAVIRYNEAFREDTLTVRITTYSPDSLRFAETLLLTVPHGHKAAPLRSQQRIPYRHRVRFGHAGTYRMTITPTRPVRGIESVGLQIEKSH